jgi:hypothetical protein
MYLFPETGNDLPSLVPADLLLSFVDLIKKYQLDAIAFTISTFLGGYGDVLSQPAFLLNPKIFNTTAINGLFDHFLITTAHNNH